MLRASKTDHHHPLLLHSAMEDDSAIRYAFVKSGYSCNKKTRGRQWRGICMIKRFDVDGKYDRITSLNQWTVRVMRFACAKQLKNWVNCNHSLCLEFYLEFSEKTLGGKNFCLRGAKILQQMRVWVLIESAQGLSQTGIWDSNRGTTRGDGSRDNTTFRSRDCQH